MKNVKLRKNILIFSLATFLLINIITVFAYYETGDSDSWSYSNYSHGSYVPKNGTMISYFYPDGNTPYIQTKVSFTLDSSNVINILDYNDGGDNPGTSADNKKCFLTLDQSAIGDSSNLRVDSFSVFSNLPDPKYDMEDDNWDGLEEETEVVALGTVSANSYYMYSYWDDLRGGSNGDSGIIQAQFAMSAKGFSDYNNVVQSDVIQAVISYGDIPAQP